MIHHDSMADSMISCGYDMVSPCVTFPLDPPQRARDQKKNKNASKNKYNSGYQEKNKNESIKK